MIKSTIYTEKLSPYLNVASKDPIIVKALVLCASSIVSTTSSNIAYMTAEGLLLQRDPQPEGGAGHHLRAVHPRPARDTQEGGRHAHLLKVTRPADENNRNYSVLLSLD